MRLTIKNIHSYLLSKGFIDLKSLVDGDYSVAQGQTRNLIFMVTRRKAQSLFVKQLSSFDQNNTYVLQKDATCQWLISNNPAFRELSGYVPEYRGFDPEKQVLITEYLADATTLEDYIRNRGGLPRGLADELAAILASYHFPMSDALRASKSVQFFPRQVPWVLNIAEMAASSQPVAVQGGSPVLGAIAASPGFMGLLAGIRNGWSATSLIHGDIKWMNLLVVQQDGREMIRVIDWEIADIGDPLWDVAGVFQGFLYNALFYGGHSSSAAAAAIVPGVTLTDLEDAWPKISHFWTSYLRKTSGAAQDDAAFEKCLRYTGARLVQSAMEQNMMMPALQPNAIKLLQASYALLSGLPAAMAGLRSHLKLESA